MTITRSALGSLGFGSVLLGVASTLGCMSQKSLRASRSVPEQIAWPADYEPEKANFFVHNAIDIEAPPQVVWEILIQAETWPRWYEGASEVEVRGPSELLQSNSVFRWKTMGIRFTSVVRQFEPYARLSWSSERTMIKGYHAWLILPRQGGCTLITDESQHGWLTFFEKVFQPRKLHRLHNVWLRAIKTKAEKQVRLAAAKP